MAQMFDAEVLLDQVRQALAVQPFPSRGHV
jgi:hypothetical protein